MANCLVTTLKESINNNSFLRINEVEPFIFDNDCKANMKEGDYVKIIVSQNAQLKFRVLNTTYEIQNSEKINITQEDDYIKLTSEPMNIPISVLFFINKSSKIFIDMSYFYSTYNVSFSSNMNAHMPTINYMALTKEIPGNMRFGITNLKIYDKSLNNFSKLIQPRQQIYPELTVDCSKLTQNSAFEYYNKIYCVLVNALNGIMPVKFAPDTFAINYTTTISMLHNCKLITNDNEKFIINNTCSYNLIVDNIYNINLYKVNADTYPLYIYTEDENDTIELSDIINSNTIGNIQLLRISNKNGKLMHFTYNKIQEIKISIVGGTHMCPKTLSDFKNFIKSVKIPENSSYFVFHYDDNIILDDEIINYINSTNNHLRLQKI